MTLLVSLLQLVNVELVQSSPLSIPFPIYSLSFVGLIQYRDLK